MCQSNKVRCTQMPLVTTIDYTNKQNDHAMIQTTYLDTYVNNRISIFFCVYMCVLTFESKNCTKT